MKEIKKKIICALCGGAFIKTKHQIACSVCGSSCSDEFGIYYPKETLCSVCFSPLLGLLSTNDFLVTYCSNPQCSSLSVSLVNNGLQANIIYEDCPIIAYHKKKDHLLVNEISAEKEREINYTPKHPIKIFYNQLVARHGYKQFVMPED